ncbi:MAG: alanyl-tRNA editing protein [Thermoplasmatales archaeon]
MPEHNALLYLDGIEGSYLKEIDVTVLGYENGGYVLDKTIMHYQGGGQPGDRGYILTDKGKIPIYNVVKDKRKILHLSNVKADIREGKLTVDWERRYKIMKMHTLQHAISAIIFKQGIRSLITEVFPGHGYIIVDRTPSFSPEIYEISKNARSLKRYNLKKEELDRELLARCNLEKLPKSLDVLSIVEIDGIDVCACAGTHVRNTKEIGDYWIRNPGKTIEFGLF